MLARFLDGTDEDLIGHEITEEFYTTEVKKNKEVAKFIPSNKAVVKSTIAFPWEGEEKSKAVALTYGIDLPSQTTLRSVVNFNPKVYVIHWRDNAVIRRYATVLKTDLGIGLWCGIYSNKAFLVNLR